MVIVMAASAAAVLPQNRGTLTLRQAMQSTVELHPLLEASQQRLAIRMGMRREIGGSFDRVYESGVQQGYTNSPVLTAFGRYTGEGVNATSIDGAARKLYRNGITAGPIAEVSRTRSNLLTPDGLSQARLGFEMILPLRRNAATQVIARENAATSDVDAARFDVNQAASDLLTETAARYWELRGALQLLEVAIGSERRGETFLDMTQTLVQADRIPRNDLNLVRANLTDRIGARIAFEQSVTAARQALGYAMGLMPEEMQRITDPAEELPEAAGVPDDDLVRAYISMALARRTDYQAAQRRTAAARALIPGLENETRPSIDVVLSTGYSGLRAGAAPTSTLASLVRGSSRPDAVAGIRYQFAPANNAAQGRLAQSVAAARQAELEASDLSRSITAAVIVAAQAVRNAALRLQRARETVAAFQDALTGERDKYTLGFGSLVDILTTEDRLTQALVVQVRAQVDYARELANLRRATGTVLAPEADLSSARAAVSDQVFRELPR
jgi:outer membrane protein TolC